jgi:hypothetical protein
VKPAAIMMNIAREKTRKTQSDSAMCLLHPHERGALFHYMSN